MLLDDMGAELGHRHRRPVDVLGLVGQRLLESGRHDTQVEPSVGAGGGERGLPAAAVVDAEALEDACPARLLENESCDVGVGRDRAHAGVLSRRGVVECVVWSSGSAATQSRLRSPRMQTSPT